MIKLAIALSLVEINPSLFVPLSFLAIFILAQFGVLEDRHFQVVFPSDKISALAVVYFFVIAYHLRPTIRIPVMLAIELTRQTQGLDFAAALKQLGEAAQRTQEHAREKLSRLYYVDSGY